MYGCFQFSKSAKREFRATMIEVNEFCEKNSIGTNYSNDYYTFELNGQKYEVKNYSYGYKEPDIIYIFASKTRLIEIYTDLKNGYELDGRGRRKKSVISA